MIADDRYTTPAAFRRALTDKLRETAKASPWTLQQLQRQVAYDRILERLYMVDDGWIVKGATALLARDLGVRGSVDVDIYRSVTQAIAETDIRRAAILDIRDWFRFDIGPATPIGNSSIRLPLHAIIGATTWATFHIDLSGTDLRMTGQPEDVPPVARGIIPEVDQRGYRAYPLVDLIADKVAATYERPWRDGESLHPISRPRRSCHHQWRLRGCRGAGTSIRVRAPRTHTAAVLRRARTDRCGKQDTRLRPGAHCWRRPTCWTMPWRLFEPSWTRCSKARRLVRGAQRSDSGRTAPHETSGPAAGRRAQPTATGRPLVGRRPDC
jgi:hypothetical protein